jgi:hypothetical protein
MRRGFLSRFFRVSKVFSRMADSRGKGMRGVLAAIITYTRTI